MISRQHDQIKNSFGETSPSTTLSKGMSQSRPFVMQSSSVKQEYQKNLNTSLMRAEHYGHHLGKMHTSEQTTQKNTLVSRPIQLTKAIQRTDDPEDQNRSGLHLNLGAGRNPMPSSGGLSINLEREPEDAKHGSQAGGDYVLADANRPPFRPGVFDAVHAINPYGFNPVNPDVSAVLAENGQLMVSGQMGRNKFASNLKDTRKPTKGAMNDPGEAGFSSPSETPLIKMHDFGTQTTTGGSSSIDTSVMKTLTYSKKPEEE